MITVIAYRVQFNSTSRTITEKITVDTIQDLEALRHDLKAKFGASYVDMVYKVKS